MNKTAEQLRAEATKHDQDAHDSFQRSDTDGFLSQWASGISAHEKRLEAELLEAGGVWEFTVLFREDGTQARKKTIKTRFGYCHAILDENDRFTGEFISLGISDKTLAKKGYYWGQAMLPAKVAIVGGGGRGLAGAASCRASIVRADYQAA
jgi:hypothetical protein